MNRTGKEGRGKIKEGKRRQRRLVRVRGVSREGRVKLGKGDKRQREGVGKEI